MYEGSGMGIGTLLFYVVAAIAILAASWTLFKDEHPAIRYIGSVVGGVLLIWCIYQSHAMLYFDATHDRVDTTAGEAATLDTPMAETPKVVIKPTFKEQRDALVEPGLSQ